MCCSLGSSKRSDIATTTLRPPICNPVAPRFADDEIDEMEGKAEILSGKLQERYVWSREEAEREVRDFRTRNNWQ